MTQQVRQKIIDKAADLFERQGYHATGLNQIVQESGTPRGSLYYYFPDGKEELAAAAVGNQGALVRQHLTQDLRAFDDPAEAVYHMITQIAGYVERADCAGGAPLAGITLEASATSERLRQACRAAYWGMRETVERKLLDAGYNAERAAQLATLVTSAIDGAIILSRATSAPGRSGRSPRNSARRAAPQRRRRSTWHPVSLHRAGRFARPER